MLLSHHILFDYVYPDQRGEVPADVMTDLLGKSHTSLRAPAGKGKICRGTLLSRAQYLTDVERWSYLDARIDPRVHMTTPERSAWTNAIDRIHRSR